MQKCYVSALMWQQRRTRPNNNIILAHKNQEAPWCRYTTLAVHQIGSELSERT